MANPLKVTTVDRGVQVRMTDGTTIRGTVNLNSESEPMRRISDLLIRGKNRFLLVTCATVQGQKERTVLINKDQIVYVEEAPEGDTP
ncbi:MAG: hypothetical protein JW765_03255 [Deltaproteobacteria bacterium]|nr:hypothetical protein [Candidatus Zymogenaceae bacterium]